MPNSFTPQQIEQFLQEFFDVVGARQYIGARYVPIFGRAGSDTVEWDDLAPYEPLTVVMHDGVSYVSRRYVPAGIEVTDTSYWVETYRFNAQVEQYRQEVLGFQDQIDQVRQDMVEGFTPFPEPPLPKYGTTGQVLTALGDGSTKWEDPVVPSDEQAEQVITSWLDQHPEATTTVQDGSVTDAKLAPNGILKRMGDLQSTTKFAAYVGNLGSFTFKYPTFNNGGQRIPWRLTPSAATIVILDVAGHRTVPFTFDQVLEAVGSTNVLTDPDGTKWVSLTAGTTVVYDYTTNALSVQYYTASVATNLVQVLVAGSGQFLGGLLYPKMLHDMLGVSTAGDIDALRLSTNIKTSVSVYVGNAGRFAFKYDDFVRNGRIAWRLSPSNATIAFTNRETHTIVGLTFDDVLEAVGASNVLTDPDGTKWVNIAPGYSLLLNYSTGALSLHGYVDTVPDDTAVLLSVTSNQFFGGLLYPKILNDMLGVSTSVDIDDLRLSTNIKGSVSAYIGNAGRFVFKYADFVRNGRIAWRLSPSNATIAFTNREAHTIVGHTFDEVLEAVGASNVLTDPDGTEWVNIAPGYSLLANYSTGVLSLQGYLDTIADDTAVLLATTTNQFMGGLLYPKMLNDMLGARTTEAIDASTAEAIGEESATGVLFSRHIPHASQVTVNPPLTLLHFSDLHADSDALGRILEEAERLTTSLDGMICTGDMVANTYGEISSWWDPSVMTCIGNHDSASYSADTGYDWNALSMADRAAYYIEPFESGWGITHSPGTSYYYKDYDDSHLRLIVIDVMLYMSPIYQTQAGVQTQWLQALLSSAITSGLHVLIAIHAPHGGSTPIPSLFTRSNQGTMPTNPDCDTPQTVIDTVADAITDGLHFVGYLCGHTHQDNMWDAAGDGSQIMYCVTCGAVSYAPYWMPSDQHRDTSHDAFNLVTIDTNNSLVKIVRGGGANMDNVTRQRNGITFDYANGVKVGEM